MSLRSLVVFRTGLLASLLVLHSSAAESISSQEPIVQATGSFMALSVADAAVTSQWYVDKLGFEIVQRIDPPNSKVHIVLLKGPGAIVEIIEHPGTKTLKDFKPDAKGPFELRGHFKAGLIVTNLDAVLQRLRARAVEIKNGPFDLPEFKLRSIVFADCEGNLVQLFGQ
jgi:catechol 2,3-dioxygenase-like lactoylglutathione lyase family enzyme